MKRKKRYVWIKREGREQWDLYGTVRSALGDTTRRVGSIKYNWTHADYRYFQAWYLINSYGWSLNYLEIIKDKLREVNNGKK